MDSVYCKATITLLISVLRDIPSFLAIGRGICEVVDGNLCDRGTTLACPEWCRGISLEDTVCSFCLTKPPAGTVREELHLIV